jgi:PTH1 family peptidyl-tRNA hydrolase
MPQTFMNASGRPVQMIASFFKIAPADMLVVHDELDFAPGVAKIKQGGGIAGHNGLRDISARVGSHDYWRLRIGVGHPGDRHAVTEYVLNKPDADDRTAIDGAIGRALDIMPLIVEGDLQSAMLKLHTPDKPVEKAVTSEATKPAKSAKPAKQPKTEKTTTPQAAPAAATVATAPAPTAAPAVTEVAAAPAGPAASAPEKKSGLKSLFKKLLPDSK